MAWRAWAPKSPRPERSGTRFRRKSKSRLFMRLWNKRNFHPENWLSRSLILKSPSSQNPAFIGFWRAMIWLLILIIFSCRWVIHLKAQLDESMSYGRPILPTSESLVRDGITCQRFWMIFPDTSYIESYSPLWPHRIWRKPWTKLLAIMEWTIS